MIDNIDNTTEEITPPLPKGFKAIKKQEVVPPLPQGFKPIKKKESTDSNSTTIPPKLVSVTSTGSSGGKGFPKIDTNSVAPGLGVQPKVSVAKIENKKTVVNYEKPKDTSFFDYLKENLDTGLATVSKSIYDAPGLVYDAAAAITNPIFKAAGVSEDRLASSDKLADNLGFKNIPSEVLQEKIRISNEKINAYSAKNGGDALKAVQDGNYVGAAKLVAGTTMQSLPIMIAAMASGGETTALSAIGLSTASTKNAQLKQENPEMGLGTRVLNATNAGIIEATTGHLFTGASGAVMKKIIADKGVEAGSKIIGKSFRTTIEKSIEKNPLVGAIGEVVEESAVEFGNQVNDMSSGIRTEFDFHAIKNAGLSATGMGGLQTLGVYGAKGYVKAKDYAKLKYINKEVFKLRSEIDNGNLSPENKAILGLRADRLEAENKKLLGTEIEKAKALPTEAKTELNALNAEFEGLKTKFDDIDDADDIPNNLKPALKEEIRIQAAKNQKRKTEILSQNDGLEVKDDFSKFEGVEPDFDLENGKISSLPLKEQDRLNKLAVEQITGGDKTIEYSKEQVSQTANEIYKNEQTPPTPEAQPQAEVPQQAEAEKVAEVSPVEDVVAPSVEENKNDEIFYTGRGKKIDDFASTKGEFIFFSKNKNISEWYGGDETKVTEANIDTSNFIDLSTQEKKAEFVKENFTEKDIQDLFPEIINRFRFEGDKEKWIKEKLESLQEDRFSGDGELQKTLLKKIKEKGHSGVVLEDTFFGKKDISYVVVDKNVIKSKNAKTPPTNPPTNGNVPLGASNVGESGKAKPKSNSKSSVPSSVDGGEVKGDAEVGKVIEPHSEVNTDVETVKKELNLSEVDNLIYDEFKDVPKTEEEILKKLEKVNDDLYGKVEKIERDINEIDIKIDDNGDAVDKIDEDENLSAAKKKKAIAVLEKEFKDLQKQQKDLEEQKESAEKFIKDIDEKINDWNPDENVAIVNGIVDKVNNRLETRKSIKEGTNLFPEDANIPEFVAVKKELIKLTDEKTIAEFNNRTAEQIEESKPIIKDIESKAENAERISKKELEKGIDDAEKLLKKPTTKERIAERIKLSDAKIDENSDVVKAKIKAFMDMFPSADINPDDYHTNGFSADAIIDMVAKAAKAIAKGGIVTSEHIKEAIKAYNMHFDDEVDPKAVEEKINPKKEEKKANNDFKSQDGKKSLLNRAFEGGNSQTITDAIEVNGLDYRIENREEAKKRAEDFVNQVGTAIALEAVRSNQIKGAEKAFVYSTIVDNLMNEIEGATNESDKQALEKIHADLIADLTNEFSQEGTDAGRFIAALNDIYNSSTLKYNLSKQIESHKAANNGEISDEVLAKFTEADKRIKELETLIKEAEAKAKVAEDELAIKNVQEDVERKKQLSNKNKSGLTPKEQTRKKELKNKFFGRLNDVTSLMTMLADPEFREYLGLTFKQAKGDLDNFSKRIITELGKGAKAHLPQLFDEAGKSAPGKSTTIKIGKDGKIKIPAQLFRDYVEAGENDIDVIAAKIKEDIADEFPDVYVRDVRDALSNYGKQVNPPKDDIVAEMSRLRSVGKLISAYEDALKGISPLKSGLKRVKPTQQMRELRKEINRLMKENGLDAVDLEKEWASALDKVKAQLKNQIEDLDKQITAGEKRKVERTTTVLDAEAESLKAVRDAKKQILDDLVGKPELTEEQLIARAEKSLQTSIDKLQKDIADGKIEYNKKPTEKQSAKLESLRKIRKDLVEAKNKMREEAGLVEAKRMETAKQRVKNQIADLKQRVIDRDYSKKVVKPLIDDSELAQLRAEKIRQQEVYDAQKYKDKLKNRSTIQKWSDAALELWNIERIIRATGELSTVLIQGGMLTVSRKFTNPKQLGIIMNKLFTSLGSAKKAERMENLIKAHPKYPLAMKAKLALANTDYKSDVREEQFTGDYANFAWDLPMLLSRVNSKFKTTLTKERTVLGDFLLNPIKKVTGFGKIGTDKISIKGQWKNANPFRVLERGSTLYMNTLRMEEFVRGVEMLEMEGKNEIDHLADYKLLANAVNSMTGRANLPSQISSSSKALAVVFFSARNAVAVVNQVNPIYYGYLHFGSTDGFQVKKTSVANKLAVTNFMRFVTITGAMILAIKAGAGDDDEGKEVVEVELDPRSSDFMKIKIGNIRFDPWHGMTGPIVLMSKFFTEEVKNINSGKIEKLEDKTFGDKTRLDLLTRFARNKFAPSMARIANTLSTNAGIDPETGEAIRVTPFGENYETEGSFTNVKPMYWDAVNEIKKENPGVLAEFLTVVSTFGWNTSVYGQKTGDSQEDKFNKTQKEIKEYNALPDKEKDKIRANNRVVSLRQKVAELENYKRAKLTNTPYLVKGAVQPADLSSFDVDAANEAIAKLNAKIEEFKTKAGDQYKEPKE